MTAPPERVVAVIQARMGSSRLPGKVLADLGGRPVLDHVVTRVRAANALDATWVATSDRAADDAVAAWCAERGVPCHRGSEEDVLGRYAATAAAAAADVVVRITADCPFVPPAMVDAVVALLRAHPRAAYAANVLPPRTFPVGFDVEAVRVAALRAAAAELPPGPAREHVTLCFRDAPDRWGAVGVRQWPALGEVQLAIDRAEDLARARALVAAVPDPLATGDTLVAAALALAGAA